MNSGHIVEAIGIRFGRLTVHPASCATPRLLGNFMKLSKLEREKLTDSVLSIQSARASLEGLDQSKVPELAELQNCLEDADRNLRLALRSRLNKETSEKP